MSVQVVSVRAPPPPATIAVQSLGAAQGAAKILLTFKCADAEDVKLKVSVTTPLLKCFEAWHKVTGTGSGTFKFMCDGKRIEGHETPEDLGCTTGDQIDVMRIQTGGVS
jgi:hypothetical protein